MADVKNLISDEEAKVALFEQKIAESKQRIAVLRSIQSEDAVDLAAGAAIAANPNVQHANKRTLLNFSSPAKTEAMPKRTVGKVGMVIMQSLKSGGKTLDEIMDALSSNGVDSTRHNVRCTLKAFRDKYGFFNNPRQGFYELTSSGSEYLQSQKGESPATSNRGAFKLQPASVSRRTN